MGAIRGNNKAVTPHFTWAEFDCHDGTRVPSDLEANVVELCQNLEIIRSAAGDHPIHVNSGYRSESYNARVGGKKASYHLKAMASDIRHPVLSPRQLADLIDQLIRNRKIKAGGVGRYATFTHYDVRGHYTTWRA